MSRLTDTQCRASQLVKLVGLLIFICLPNSLLARNFTGNFTGNDTEILHAAEAARRESALFWSGQDLPGNWFRPCPIDIDFAQHSGSGRTSFLFQRGEVSGWRMSVSGTREAILNDVIPHEVDHMVRASLARQPMERWLDEGSASLMESAASHQQLRERARSIDPQIVTSDWLSSKSYPADRRELEQVYVIGFSLVEYLIEQRGPQQLLAFQTASGSIDERLAKLYGFDSRRLQHQWSAWHVERMRRGTACNHCGCIRHGRRDASPEICVPLTEQPLVSPLPLPSRPVPLSSPITNDAKQPFQQSKPRTKLRIWTASWCGPCHQFRSDYEGDPEFRKKITSRFDVVFLKIDQHQQLAQQAEITAVPTFETQAARWVGYQGKTDFLNRLRELEQVLDNSSLPSPLSVQEPLDAAPASLPSVPNLNSENHQQVPPSTPPVEKEPAIPPPRQRPMIQEQDSSQPASSEVAIRESTSTTDAIHSALSQLMMAVVKWGGVTAFATATGGAGGIGLGLLMMWLRQRTQRRFKNIRDEQKGGVDVCSAPFPRNLDEARQLLAIRQSEGRVAVLDALRGMFLDDELEKLFQGKNEAATVWASELKSALDRRVDEVAPRSTRVTE